ncbi:MAG: PKD domain-containing protein [Methanomicrobiaceae archaeon]|nr:PKD domain-containing protein [Methanomicrobiaceae archaeon]
MILFTMLMLSFCLIPPASAIHYNAAGTISTITEYPEERWENEISGENVIWIEPESSYGGQALYLYNIATMRTRKVASSKYTTYHPCIGSHLIFWGDRSGSQGPVQIARYNILNRNLSFIDPYLSNQDFPATDDDIVVWLDSRSGGYTNIYILKGQNGDSALFHQSDTSDKHNPEISDGYVYWVEKEILYRKNIESGALEAIISGMPLDFSISENLVVWDNEKDGESDIVLLDTTTFYVDKAVERPGNQINPDINKKNIVWQEYNNEKNSIWIKNIDTGISAEIYSSGSRQEEPAISGRKVIWLDKTPGSEGIRMFVMDESVRPSAEFTSDAKESLPPLTVHFVPEITTPVDIMPRTLWDFGDGTFSTETGPEHTYTFPGVYNVTLTVYNEFGEDIIFKPSHVVIGELPQPDFSSDRTSGDLPLTIRFKDVSSGPYDTRLWDFGDGTGSILKNPIHKYEKSGLYTVSLTLSNEYGSVREEKFAYIHAGTESLSEPATSQESETYGISGFLSLISTGDGQPGSIIPSYDIHNMIESLSSE